MKKGLVALICTIISFILVFICFIFPLYNIHYTEPDEYYSDFYGPYGNTSYPQNRESEYNLDFHQTYLKLKQKMSFVNYAASIDYSDYKEQLESYSGSQYNKSEITKYENMFSIYNYTFYLFIVVIIFVILALIFTIFSILPTKNFKIYKKLGFIFHIIVSILVIVTAIYFFISFDNYIKDDLPSAFLGSSSLKNIGEPSFWHSYKGEGLDFSMGPGLGWYFMFIICFLSMFSAVLIYLNHQPWIPKYIPSQITPGIQSTYPPMDSYSDNQNHIIR